MQEYDSLLRASPQNKSSVSAFLIRLITLLIKPRTK